MTEHYSWQTPAAPAAIALLHCAPMLGCWAGCHRPVGWYSPACAMPRGRSSMRSSSACCRMAVGRSAVTADRDPPGDRGSTAWAWPQGRDDDPWLIAGGN